jgi:hypothetical protein
MMTFLQETPGDGVKRMIKLVILQQFRDLSNQFLKFVRLKGADFRQVQQKPHIWRSYCPSNMSCGYWFLVKQIAYVTLVLNITVVFVQVSQIANPVNEVIRSRSVTLSLIRGIPLKNIAYNLVIADSYQILNLKLVPINGNCLKALASIS